MNKKLYYIILFLLVCFMVTPQNTKALSPSEYANRHKCSKFELAGAHTDGVADFVGCYDTYQAAKNAMTSNGASDLIIFDETGTTKLIDAQYGLVDLTVNSLTYFYETSALNTRIYTAINTSSSYGGVDAAFIETSASNYAAKVKIANFTGWIAKDNYVIVPLNWVKSSSSYQISNDSIRHNYVENIKDTYSGGSGRTIGPKPTMLSNGTYYSYDGHYFYKTREAMLKDYKNNNYNNSVNKDNAYYNYYMYLSNHTKTNYSAINIDEYTRNVLGYSNNVYGSTAKTGTSRLNGEGTYFYNAQQKYGVNALLSYSLSRNETGNGRSNLAINNNNGFGLNAVDSSPTESAYYYASFSASILGYASKWVEYGYSYATDWRYFGPSFGDKYNGMNVKYATDAYWSEKMAANYYSFDKYYGLNDYNYYQLGVVNKPTNAYLNTSQSKTIYTYPEVEDQVVIVGEDGNYYKVMSDINIDSNGNTIGSKTDYQNYNWNSAVYVKKSDVNKINTAKNGYKAPNSVTNYKDSAYNYDLYIENTVLKPKVATLTKDTDYYYDSTLTSKTNKKVLKDKWVMVYASAKSSSGEIVAYLITSDYLTDQKRWVSADSIKFITSGYGKQIVNIEGAYEWVCSEAIDNEKYKIGGQYTNSYVPLLTSKNVNGLVWYKVPVSLDTNTNSYGWIMSQEANAHIEFTMSQVTNNDPVISATDKTITQGTTFKALDGIKATDQEDGDLTASIEVTLNNVNIDVVGKYQVTYQVKDKNNSTVTKTINLEVIKNNAPTINAKDIELIEKKEFNELENVTATDTEDGDLTKKIEVVENTVNTKTPGTYKVIYKVSDSYNQTTMKEIKVVVIKDEEPVINAEDRQITINKEYDELENVTATDKEDKDLTNKIEVIENTVNNKRIGQYSIKYQVKDSFGHITVKNIKVEVVKDQTPVINAEDRVINLNSKFSELVNVNATDTEDGDLTKAIEVVENTVNTKTPGTYKVIYKVTDSYGNITTKEIKVIVVEKELTQREGMSYFYYLKNNSNKLNLVGYQTITGIDNNLNTDIYYEIVFENIETQTETTIEASRITTKTDIPKAVYSPDGKDYTYSWYNAEIDVDNIPQGNYKMYVVAKTDELYSKSLISNKTYNKQSTEVESNNKSATINNNYDTSTSFIEIKVRNEKLSPKTSSYIYNQYEKFTKFEFNEDNKLYLRGNSYSYEMDLSSNSNVERKIIFENKDTYKTYQKDLGSITNGNYNVILPVKDNFDKTRAWYDANIDISNIPKGEYLIYISTKSNISDISEMKEKLSRSLSNVTTTINNKIYSFTINKSRGNRIELIVK